MTNEQTVTISVAEYEELLDAAMWEEAFRSAGVDNWDGYDDAMTIYRDIKSDEQ